MCVFWQKKGWIYLWTRWVAHRVLTLYSITAHIRSHSALSILSQVASVLSLYTALVLVTTSRDAYTFSQTSKVLWSGQDIHDGILPPIRGEVPA